MKIEIKIMPKEEFNEDGVDWSEGVSIRDFISDPRNIEFSWEDGSTLPYNDFIYFEDEYYLGIFINGKNVDEVDKKSKCDHIIGVWYDYEDTETITLKELKGRINHIKELNKIKMQEFDGYLDVEAEYELKDYFKKEGCGHFEKFNYCPICGEIIVPEE